MVMPCNRLPLFTCSSNDTYLHKSIMTFCCSFPVMIENAEDEDRQKYRMRQLERRSTSWKQNLSRQVRVIAFFLLLFVVVVGFFSEISICFAIHI